MVVMEWLNQKTANFLHDFGEERVPAEQPRRARSTCRLLFVVVLIILAFASLVYLFQTAPEVRLEHIHLEGKDKDYAIHHLYDRESSNLYLTQKRNNAVCPCDTTSISWKDFLNFYILSEDSTEWQITQDRSTHEYFVPEGDGAALKNHVHKIDLKPMTAETFCNMSMLFPDDPEVTLNNQNIKQNCLWMVSSLLPGQVTQYQDNPRITLLESPVLLNREIFNMIVAQRARDVILKRQLIVDLTSVKDINLTYYFAAVSFFFIQALGNYDIPDWQSYAYGSHLMVNTLNVKRSYGDLTPSIIVLAADREFCFPHVEFDWKKYYLRCQPQYCQVTSRMGSLRKAYWAFGLMGGVSSIVMGLVTLLLWPATGFVLAKCSRN